MEDKTDKRGGARKKAGRKTDYPGKKVRTLTLTDECIALAKQIGEGNISNGIEIAVRMAATTHEAIAANSDNQTSESSALNPDS